MSRSPEPPPAALVLRTYRELDQFVGAFAEGLLNLLLIIGRPGVQKSQTVQRGERTVVPRALTSRGVLSRESESFWRKNGPPQGKPAAHAFSWTQRERRCQFNPRRKKL